MIRRRLAALNPPPVRASIPLLIGGKGEKVMLRIVAEHADILNGSGDPETFRHKNERARRVVREGWQGPWRDRALRHASQGGARRGSNVPAFLAAGVTHLIYSAGGADLDLGLVAELVAWRDAPSSRPRHSGRRAAKTCARKGVLNGWSPSSAARFVATAAVICGSRVGSRSRISPTDRIPLDQPPRCLRRRWALSPRIDG